MENHILLSIHSTEDDFIEQELLRKLEEILNECTEIQQRRFKMFFYVGMNYSEIAKHEKTSHVAVIKSIKQVFKIVKKNLF